MPTATLQGQLEIVVCIHSEQNMYSFFFFFPKYVILRTSLVVQWTGIHLPVQGDMDLIPGLGRFHMPQST